MAVREARRLGCPPVRLVLLRLGVVEVECGACKRPTTAVVVIFPAQRLRIEAHALAQPVCSCDRVGSAAIFHDEVDGGLPSRASPMSTPQSLMPLGEIDRSSSRLRPRSTEEIRQAPVPGWYLALANIAGTHEDRLASAAVLTSLKNPLPSPFAVDGVASCGGSVPDRPSSWSRPFLSLLWPLPWPRPP